MTTTTTAAAIMLLTIAIDVTDCPKVERLEHVIANISFKYSVRGDIKLTLVSPSNTPSEILSHRRNDLSSKGNSIVFNFKNFFLFKFFKVPKTFLL